MSWRGFSNWAKRKPLTLRLADWLGRGRGRLRWFDSLNAPARAELKPDLKDWQNREFAAAWIGHATVLLRVNGLNILTDPVFSNRIGVGLGLITGGPRRYVAAALSVRQLPPLDLILISHAHFDHLDRQTLVRLDKRVPIITANQTADLVRDLGFRQVFELRWGEKAKIDGVSITAQKVVHWGARTFFDHHRGFNAYVIESSRRRVLYSGDTAYHELFKGIGKVDLAIMGIGAYDPYIQAHATPEQAWAMANHVRAEHVLPMHHSTFRLSHEPMHEPIERIVMAAGKEVERIAAREIGGTWVGN